MDGAQTGTRAGSARLSGEGLPGCLPLRPVDRARPPPPDWRGQGAQSNSHPVQSPPGTRLSVRLSPASSPPGSGAGPALRSEKHRAACQDIPALGCVSSPAHTAGSPARLWASGQLPDPLWTREVQGNEVLSLGTTYGPEVQQPRITSRTQPVWQERTRRLRPAEPPIPCVLETQALSPQPVRGRGGAGSPAAPAPLWPPRLASPLSGRETGAWGEGSESEGPGASRLCQASPRLGPEAEPLPAAFQCGRLWGHPSEGPMAEVSPEGLCWPAASSCRWTPRLPLPGQQRHLVALGPDVFVRDQREELGEGLTQDDRQNPDSCPRA